MFGWPGGGGFSASNNVFASKHAAAGIQIHHTVHFFIVTKVFAHLTHLKLPKISQTYLKFLIWLQQLIQTCLDYYEK